MDQQTNEEIYSSAVAEVLEAKLVFSTAVAEALEATVIKRTIF